ncbi:ParM/StbA family protein (plasmid) [Cytobacillus oceanisediminis]|uniref:ParM/StbA family protein n=1 Tax=Cytobacillus oceanisediminis TaxID=665099 RepID=UPI001863A73A|nr:ParM/StbA family protein [Cytobacillus oceanisediminis]QOK29994.1 ParM/StbA family protein [Cytobacillus oceanisediminis]
MSKIPEMLLDCSNDNGNSEQAMFINGELLRQPNVYAEPSSKGFVDNVSPESLMDNLMNQIDVTISSSSIDFDGRYYIGRKAIKSQYQPFSMDVALDTKYNSDLPIINTIGTLAAKSVQNYFTKNKKIPSELNVKVNMLTALPVEQWNPENADYFAKRFTGDKETLIHSVVVHINNIDVHVKITFESVRVAAEGVPALFALLFDENLNYRNDDIFNNYKDTYGKEITGESLKGKRISHIDIGDGTTDMPVTNGFNLDTHYVTGCDHGVGHAIEDALKNFKEQHNSLKKLTRQKFSEYLKEEDHQYHRDAVRYFQKTALTQSKFIFKEYQRVLSAFDNEVDMIVVYGGGSIVLKESLFPLLKGLADKREKEILWVPEEYAPLMNVEGLSVLQKRLNKQSKQKVKS